MKRSTLLALIGLLTLPAFTLAVPVDSDAPDGVAAIIWAGDNNGRICILGTDGTAWCTEDGNPIAFSHSVNHNVPVDLSDIADWEYYYLRTNDGVVWAQYGGWHTIDLPPIAPPVQSDQQSLGSLKQMFR